MKQTVTTINLMDISVQSWKLNYNCDIPWGNQLSMTVMVFVDKVMIHKSEYHKLNGYLIALGKIIITVFFTWLQLNIH